MASLEKKIQRGYSYVVRFYLDGKARKIFLSSVYSEVDAIRAKLAVERVLVAMKTGEPLDNGTRRYFEDAPPDLLKRFAHFYVPDLPNAKPGALRSCVDLWEEYRNESKAEVKEATLKSRDVAFARLIDYFGKDVTFPDFTHDAVRQCIVAAYANLKKNTVHRSIGLWRGFANWAINKGYINDNPFLGFSKKVVRVESRERYIPREEFEKVLSHARSVVDRVLFCLWRYGGLRRGEPEFLTRDSIDWKNNLLRVWSSKTEAHDYEGWRTVPIIPPLRRELERLVAEMPENETRLIYNRKLGSYRAALSRAIDEAGVERWPRLCQNLRVSFENDLLEQKFPQHVAAAWLGHSVATQATYYSKVLPSHIAAAIAGNRLDADGDENRGVKRGLNDLPW